MCLTQVLASRHPTPARHAGLGRCTPASAPGGGAADRPPDDRRGRTRQAWKASSASRSRSTARSSRAVSSSNGSRTIRPSLSDHAPGDDAVDEVRPHGERVLRREDARPVLLRQQPGPSRVDQQVRIPVRQEPHGRRACRDPAAGRRAGPPAGRHPRRGSDRRSRLACGLLGGRDRDPGPGCDVLATPRVRTRAGTPARCAPGRRPRWRSAGPTQSSARARRSARRRSHVPAGGTRTRSTHSPSVPTKPVARSPSSLTVRGPSARAARMRSAAASMSRSPAPLTRIAVFRHCSRRAWRTPSAKGQYSRRETMWIVTRMSVAWMTDRSSNAARKSRRVRSRRASSTGRHTRTARTGSAGRRPGPRRPGSTASNVQATAVVPGARGSGRAASGSGQPPDDDGISSDRGGRMLRVMASDGRSIDGARRAPWPRATAMLIPLAGLGLLLARPELDIDWEHHPSHFWLVLDRGRRQRRRWRTSRTWPPAGTETRG